MRYPRNGRLATRMDNIRYIANSLDEDLSNPNAMKAGAEQAVGLPQGKDLDTKNQLLKQQQMQKKAQQEKQKKLAPLKSAINNQIAAQKKIQDQAAKTQRDALKTTQDYFDAINQISSQI